MSWPPPVTVVAQPQGYVGETERERQAAEVAAKMAAEQERRVLDVVVRESGLMAEIKSRVDALTVDGRRVRSIHVQTWARLVIALRDADNLPLEGAMVPAVKTRAKGNPVAHLYGIPVYEDKETPVDELWLCIGPPGEGSFERVRLPAMQPSSP